MQCRISDTNLPYLPTSQDLVGLSISWVMDIVCVCVRYVCGTGRRRRERERWDGRLWQCWIGRYCPVG